MKAIHIANAKKLDAQVAVDVHYEKKRVHTVLPDGSEKINVKILKYTAEQRPEILLGKFGEDLQLMAEEITDSDPEVDMETAGKLIRYTRKLYVDEAYQIVYRVNLLQVVRNPDGTEKERRDLNRVPGNINSDIPIQWTGKSFKKKEAVRRFVFGRKYQLRHVNGVTYDFLYNMARELDRTRELMMVGSGAHGQKPIVLTRGGQSYRGFLEGRVKEDKYCLILHLADIELKGVYQRE